LEAVMHTPDGRAESVRSQAFEEASLLRWGDTDVSGVYKLVIGQHPREHLFAVNVPAATDAQEASESNPARADREGLQKLYPEWDFQKVTDLHDVVHSGGTTGAPELLYRPLGTAIARWLLLAVLALLGAEVVLAWHFGHYSRVAGTPGARPAEGRLVPGLVTALAGVLCLSVAAVLIHAAWTGDFLGFLPEALRQGFEAALHIPPPAPGEG